MANQIESVHDLHSFFYALLARSNRTPTVYTPSDVPECDSMNRLFPHRNEASQQGRNSNKVRKTSKTSKGNKDERQLPNVESSSGGVSVENVSLEELFMNIDRVIANDFLETLSPLDN